MPQIVSSHTLRWGIFVCLVLFVGLVCSVFLFPRWLCSMSEEKAALAGFNISMRTMINRCSAMDGTIRIYTVNDSTGKKDEVLFLPEEVESSVRFISRTIAEIILPNRVDIERQKFTSQGIRIVYRFVPRDDEKDRAEYKFYIEHPNDPHAVAWAKKNMRVKYVYLGGGNRNRP